MKVSGLFDASNVSSEGCIDISGLRCGSDVWFHSVNIKCFTSTVKLTGENSTCTPNAEPGVWDHPESNGITDLNQGTSLNLELSHINGSLYISSLDDAPTEIYGCLDLRANITGQVALIGVKLTCKQDTDAIRLSQSQIGDSVFLQQSTIEGRIDLRSRINGQLNLSECNISGDRALTTCDGHIKTSLFISTCTFNGLVDLRNTNIEGHFDIKNTVFSNSDSTGDHAPAVLMNCLHVLGPTRLTNLSITGKLELNFADFKGLFRGSSIVCNGISARHSAIRSDCNFWGVKTNKPQKLEETATSDFEFMAVGGHLHFDKCSFDDTVALRSATVGGDLELSESNLKKNLDGSGIEVGGKAIISDHINGEVDLQQSIIQELQLTIKEDKLFDRPKFICARNATVQIVRITTRLPDPQNRYQNYFPPFFDFEGTHVAQFIVSDDTSQPTTIPISGRDKTRLALTCLSLLLAVIHAGYFGHFAAFFFISILYGIFYTAHWKEKGDRNCEAILQFLELTFPFSMGFYMALERLMREKGNVYVADEIYIKRRRRESEVPREIPRRWQFDVKSTPVVEVKSRPRFFGRCWYQFLEYMTGYGVRTSRMVFLFILSWILTASIFVNPRSVERPLVFVQTRSDNVVNGQFPHRPSELNPARSNPWPADGGHVDYTDGEEFDWGIQNAFFVAMRVQLPLISTEAENDWSPATRNLFGKSWLPTFANIAAVLRIVNLVLVSMIIAGLTGHVISRQAR
ncbi:MAG: hypothetical protein U0936_16885 [Planctomycetaceae bacterium]